MQPLVYRYDDEEWDNVIVKDADWTREETEYLLELCEQFQLRFLIIADRYEVTLMQAPYLHQVTDPCLRQDKFWGKGLMRVCKTALSELASVPG